MNADFLKGIQQAGHDELFGAGWVIALLSLTSAGVAAFVSAYLNKRGEHLATREAFGELLKQVKTQTEVTEGIKADVSRELTSFGNALERGREFAGFRRERIAKHLDQVIDAYIEMYAIAQLLPLSQWVDSSADLDAETRFRLSLSRLRVHFGALIGLGVIREEEQCVFREKDALVLNSWDEVLGEAANRTNAFRAKHPNLPAFSRQKYQDKWLDFMTQIEALGKLVKNLSKHIALPE